jgi:predicted HD phosphohydrolase
MSADEVRAFEALPYAADAVRLRRWDDFGKKADAHTPPLSFFLDLARRCARAA